MHRWFRVKCQSYLNYISSHLFSDHQIAHFLIILLYLLLLPVLNVNSVIFTLINSDWFYICFYSVVLGYLLVQLMLP